MKTPQYLLIVFACVSSVISAPPSQFRVIKEWKYINYTWDRAEDHEIALNKGEYIPEHNLMAGINYYDGYYYLAIPRMKSGIPVTLARIPSANPRAAPLLTPFPSWDMNKLGDCQALQNVQNVAVDASGKMWIIDGGKTGTLTRTPNDTCSPKLVIFDLRSNSVTTSYNFPEEVLNKSVSFLYDLVLDDSDGGYAYITDNSRFDPGLVIFSLKQNKSWKIRNDKSMRADPNATNFIVNQVRITAPINIAGIALGPKTNVNEQNITLNADREVFYSPISSLHLYSTRSTYLKDEKYSKVESFNQYVKDIGIKAAQSDGMKMDNKGVLYYGLLSIASISRWDSNTPFSSGQKVISRDDTYIKWPNSFAFDDIGNILVLTNSLEKYVHGNLSLLEPNFNILMAYVGGKSYVYDDETLVYSVHETDKQKLKSDSTISSTTLKSVENITATSDKTNAEASTTKSDIGAVKTNSVNVTNTGEVKIEAAPNSGARTKTVTSFVTLVLYVCFHELLY